MRASTAGALTADSPAPVLSATAAPPLPRGDGRPANCHPGATNPLPHITVSTLCTGLARPHDRANRRDEWTRRAATTAVEETRWRAPPHRR